jgi:hypothetical protein
VHEKPTTLAPTAVDSVNSRSASADFAVAPPTIPGAVTNGESFASLLGALDSIYALKPQLQAARTANSVPLMTSLLRQIVTTWRTAVVQTVSCGKFGRVVVLINSTIDHAARAARQISGSVARCPPWQPLLHLCSS